MYVYVKKTDIGSPALIAKQKAGKYIEYVNRVDLERLIKQTAKCASSGHCLQVETFY